MSAAGELEIRLHCDLEGEVRRLRRAAGVVGRNPRAVLLRDLQAEAHELAAAVASAGDHRPSAAEAPAAVRR